MNEKCSLILRGLRVPIWKINFFSSVLRFSELPRCNWGKVADCHTLFRMIREIKVSSDWFGCVLVISFYFAKVFSESSPSRPLVSSGPPPCSTNWSTVSTKNGWEGKHWPHSIHSHIHPHNHAVRSIILKNFKLLQNDSENGTIFSQPLLISFKRDKNIGNFLVRISFQTNDHSETFKCARSHAKLVLSFIT